MKIAYNNIWAVCDKTDKEKYKEIRTALSYEITGAEYSDKYQDGLWDGTASMARYYKFSSGLIPIVKDLVDDLEFIDRRPENYSNNIPLNLHEKELRDYQQQAIDLFLEEERGIIKLATRSGKTLIAAAITQILGKRTLFITDTKNLMRQAQEDYRDIICVNPGQIGDGIYDPQDITVGIIKSVGGRAKAKNKEMLDFLKTIEFLIFDEVHKAADLYQIASLCSPAARWRLGLSATACVEDRKNCLESQAITGPILYSVDNKELMDGDYIAKALVLFIEIPNKAKITKGKYKYWPAVYKEANTEFLPLNLSICICSVKRVQQGQTVLIITQSRRHGVILCDMMKHKINPKFINGDSSIEERKEALRELGDGTIDVLISTRIFNEGVNIPFLSTVINGAGGKSVVDLYQRYGRPLTKTEDKEGGLIIDFINNGHPDLREHSEIRYEVISADPAFEVKRITLEDYDNHVTDIY